MPDNVLLNGVTEPGGQIIATFADSGGIEHEKVLNEYIDDGTGQPVLVSQSNPLPVTGTVTIDTSTLATSSNQTNAAQKTQVVDGSGNVIGATSNALDINIKSGSIANTSFAATQGTATNLKTQAENYQGGSAVGAGNPLQVTGANGTFPVSGTVTATPTGTQDVNLKQVNGQTIDVGVGAAGTGTQRVTTSTDSTVQAVGNIAHDSIDSGNPIKVGNKAIAFGANPTAVASGDRTDAYANVAGIQFVLGGHPNIVTLEAAYTSAQTDAAIVTISTGNKIVVTEIEALCDNANTVNVGVRVGFGAASTPTTTGVVLTHPGIAPGSGVVRGNGSGILGVGADNEDLRITSQVPTSGSLRILVSYFTIAV